jgi:hypothetical protein
VLARRDIGLTRTPKLKGLGRGVLTGWARIVGAPFEVTSPSWGRTELARPVGIIRDGRPSKARAWRVKAEVRRKAEFSCTAEQEEQVCRHAPNTAARDPTRSPRSSDHPFAPRRSHPARPTGRSPSAFGSRGSRHRKGDERVAAVSAMGQALGYECGRLPPAPSTTGQPRAPGPLPIRVARLEQSAHPEAETPELF